MNEYLLFRGLAPGIQAAPTPQEQAPVIPSHTEEEPSTSAQGEEAEGDVTMHEIVSSFPERRQSKVAQILCGFKNHPDKLDYDRDTGEILVRRQVIPHSSIFDVVDYISKPRVSSTSKPTGLGRVLQNQGEIPTFNASLIPNVMIRSHVQQACTAYIARQMTSEEQQTVCACWTWSSKMGPIINTLCIFYCYEYKVINQGHMWTC